MATGGFAASRPLLKRFTPRWARMPTTNGAFATGDGLDIAISAGAFIVDVSEVQVHPTAFVDPEFPLQVTQHRAVVS